MSCLVLLRKAIILFPSDEPQDVIKFEVDIMYAIVDIRGVQHKVSEGSIIWAPLMNNIEGEEMELDKVLLVHKENEVLVGAPYVEGAKIQVKMLGTTKGKKIIVFKYKRRKDFRLKKGHRQRYSVMKVEKISA